MRSGLVVAGRYRLEALLGRGGMGEVWRGADTRLGRPVAVKLLAIPEGTESALVHRFHREVEISARLRHPNIVVVHDGGEDAGLLFLVMELLEGDDLSAVLRGHPDGLPVERAVRIAAQVADALGAAHGRGVVHRDIKPANVMLLPGDHVTVMDFGIARHADQVTELTGNAVIGTPAYMAPEQFDGGDAGPAADLYAVGVLLFALLTGRTPFKADTFPMLVRSIVLEPAPRLRSLRPDLPGALDRLLDALLAKDPSARPADARTVAELVRAATAPPPFPPPVPPPVREAAGTRVERIVTAEGGSTANSYVVGDDGEVFVIDPAYHVEPVRRAVGARDTVAVVLTDGEEVHVRNARHVSAHAYVALPHAALPNWRAHHERLGARAADPNQRRAMRKHRPDTLFKRDEEFEIGDVRLTVLDVPSPWRGSVWLYSEELDALFTGFTLLASDPNQRRDQAALLSRLPAATRVLPGWGDETTVGALLGRPDQRL